MRNIEVKARMDSFGGLRRLLAGLGFRRERRLLAQTDSYFAVPRGRLKLRQRQGDRAGELILYVRSNENRPRASDFQKLTVDDPPHMLRVLRGMFEPGVRVRKRRELWLRDDARVHLDEVSGLGRFVEIEVPVRAGRNATDARREMRDVVRALGIARASVVAVSYADLLHARQGR